MKIDNRRVSIGIDVGTTNIGAAALDSETGEVCEAGSFPGNAAIPSEFPWEKTQDPGRLFDAVKKRLDGMLDRYPNAVSVGFTGQMHGIVFADGEGRAVSPLFTWQDERAGLGEPSSCRIIEERTGYRTAPGYGLATAFDLLRHGGLPEGAVSLATVMDWIVCRLTGRKKPLTHVSNAASLGLFDLRRGRFDLHAADELGLAAYLPEVTAERIPAGCYRGVPVSAAIGDNQAAFLGAVKEPERTALANIGTGSQISLVTESFLTPEQEECGLELRPFVDGKFLVSGSALCGGRAYALLERFFRSYIREACGIDAPQYEVLNRLAAEGLAAWREKENTVMRVCPTFAGTRTDPSATGSFTGVTEENFHPASLAAGMVLGMAEELAHLFRQSPKEGIDRLIASGSAVRRNPALLTALSQVFGMDVALSGREEEAAVGAAEFALRAAGSAESSERNAAEA